MDLQLADKTALITGASAGIGRGIAKALAAEGVKTVIAARRDGPTPVVVISDLYEDNASANLASAAIEAVGHIDILINNAGGSRPFVDLHVEEERWEEAFTLNFHRPRQLADALIDQMIERSWGRIINITGKSEPDHVNGAFCAKAGMHSWAKGLSRMVGKHGITVNCIPPGRIHSEQIYRNYTPEYRQWQCDNEIPMARYGEPEDLAAAVAGLGGGLLLLALMAQMFAPAVLIPLHGVAQFFSNVNRGWIHRSRLQWQYLRPFMAGSIVGAFAFVPLVVFVDPVIGAMAVGLFILLVTWFPQWLSVSRLHPLFSGGITSGLGVLFGATGPLAMSAHPKKDWTKQQIVGNHGAAMGFQHGAKVMAYLVVGVQLYNYIPHIVVLFVGAWLGTYLGTRLLEKFSDDRFKTLLKWVLTLLALRLILLNGYAGIQTYTMRPCRRQTQKIRRSIAINSWLSVCSMPISNPATICASKRWRKSLESVAHR